MKLVKAILAAAISIASTSVMAEKITLSKNILHFDNNENKREAVEVINLLPGTTAYFETILREVTEPQKGTKSKMIEHSDPSLSGLFVSPNKAVILENDHKVNLSIINVNENLEKERVYRIDVRPVISGLEKAGDGARVKTLIAYDILVHVQPNKPVVDYEYNFNDDSFLITNTGNSHFEMLDGKECVDEKNCSPIPSGKLYADAMSLIPLNPETKYVEYSIKMRGGEVEYVKFEK